MPPTQSPGCSDCKTATSGGLGKRLGKFWPRATGEVETMGKQRSIAGGCYGATPASTVIGPEGGAILVEWTVQAINAVWGE